MDRDRIIESLATEAVRMFGDQGDGLFNTAGFQQAALEECARVVRLSGGCHWMLLPDRLQRFQFPPSK